MLLYVHRSRKGTLGRKAHDGHFDFHTPPELWNQMREDCEVFCLCKARPEQHRNGWGLRWHFFSSVWQPLGVKVDRVTRFVFMGLNVYIERLHTLNVYIESHERLAMKVTIHPRAVWLTTTYSLFHGLWSGQKVWRSLSLWTCDNPVGQMRSVRTFLPWAMTEFVTSSWRLTWVDENSAIEILASK